MDLQMPEMNGYEAALTIRNLSGSYFKNVPIVALSAEVTSEVKKEVHLYGMNDSLTKPFNPSELYHSIKNLLKKF
ncbi:MAG: response regulator, partial [Ignavibacteria bacterium]|nr:response regulator [Ignavibacteria bacterium]